MKKVVARQLVIGVVILSICNFGFAQTSETSPLDCTSTSICGTAPKQFTLLLDFVREMMNSIKTIGTQWEYLGQYINPNRYADNVFTPPANTVVTKTLRNINQKAKFALASTAIFSTPVNFAGLKDVLWWTVLLAKDKVFLRDTKLVEALESQLSDKRYELGLWWWRYTQINASNRKTMEIIIQKYIDAWLFSQWSLADGVQYNNITSLLVSMLSATKTFLYFDRIDQFSTDYFSRWGLNGIKITFAPDVFMTIQNEYRCVTWPYSVCDSRSGQFKKNIEKMTSSITKSATWFVTTIRDASLRLGQLFLKEDNQSEAFKQREANLLKTMYGTTKNSKWVFGGSLKKSFSSIWSDIKTLWSDVSRFRSPSVDDSQKTKDEIETLRAQQPTIPTSPAQGEETFKAYIRSYTKDVFDQEASDIQLAYLAETKDVTPGFTVLGKQIFTIKNDIIGSKDLEWSLIKSLSEAADLQCSIR